MAPRRNTKRGITMLESMIAMAVLSVGVLGVIQALLIAANQNSMAGRMQRATAIASTVRTTLQARGLASLVQVNGPLNSALGLPFAGIPATLTTALQSNRNTGTDIASALNGAGLTGVRYLKLDDDYDFSSGAPVVTATGYDANGSTPADQRLLPQMEPDEHHIFDVWLVYDNDITAGNPTDLNGTKTGIKTMLVVVVWREGGQIRRHIQATSVYDTGFNQSGARELF